MMNALLRLRFRAFFAGMTRQSRRKDGKRGGKGMIVLMVFLYVYVAVVLCGAMALMFHGLAQTYHTLGLDWLYFAMAGLIGLGLCVLGSVFMTQSQLYDAKDNDLLLSMPIPPGRILLSRMLPLLVMNLFYAAVVMGPAMVIYAVEVAVLPVGLVLQGISLLAVVLLAQGIACLLGWLLHLLLSKINRSVASVFYMVVFLGIYFTFYTRSQDILATIAASGAEIGSTLKNWVWPLYAMGVGSVGSVPMTLAFVLICAGVFALTYWILSATFLRTAASRKSAKRRKLSLGELKAGSVSGALVQKQWRHFLGSPVYLTNMGIGVILAAAMAVAGVIFRDRITAPMQSAFPGIQEVYAPIICAILSFAASTICVSAPSISLEGKTIWILKAMPISGREILLGKLKFHCLVATPVTVLAGLVLGIAYGCGAASLLCAAVPGLFTVLLGLLGLICDLNWTRLDWISEAYPCKQSVPVMVIIFSAMGAIFALVILGVLLCQWIRPWLYLVLCALLLLGLCGILYRALMGWGVKQWEKL